MNDKLTDLNIDALTGVRLMEKLGITPIDLQNPIRFSRLQQVIEFLKQYPEDTQDFLISKVTTGKVGDRLDKFFEYSQVLQKKQGFEKELDGIKKESSAFPHDIDPMIRILHAQKEMRVVDSLRSIEQEKIIYEQ